MASKVRFSEQVQSSYAARVWELMPHRIAEDAQTEIRDDLFAKAAKGFDIAKQIRRTTVRIHQPLSANIHDDCFRTLRLDLAAELRERPLQF